MYENHIADITLAPEGEKKIRWVAGHMPVLAAIAEDFRETKPLAGLRVALSVHLEAKTAWLCRVMEMGGAEMHVTGSNPLSTQDDVAAALAAGGMHVCAVHGATGFLQQGDVMVFASRGGKTKELLPIVDICKAKGVSIITVTENLESPLAQAADVVLKQHVNRETDKWNAQGTTSTTALCMIFHALQAALIEETGYQAEQFALIHPGGAVGERLNHKAL